MYEINLIQEGGEYVGKFQVPDDALFSQKQHTFFVEITYSRRSRSSSSRVNFAFHHPGGDFEKFISLGGGDRGSVTLLERSGYDFLPTEGTYSFSVSGDNSRISRIHVLIREYRQKWGG